MIGSKAVTMKRLVWFLFFAFPAIVRGQIPQPTDMPKPLSPEESIRRMAMPPGFRVEAIAAEPNVREPSDVCWDERGRMFVCELHGYNMEGQYDVEELNKTGKLDHVVRRIGASGEAVKKAEKDTYGTVKRLIDTDHDGRMDKAVVWADRLPPCFGLCPARDGLIVVCSPHIIFLADRDGDDRAEIREQLFTGFQTRALERRMSTPRWGIDNWIYVSRGGGGRITGPHLKEAVQLPDTDFRIKSDGSAIEPVVGGTHTIGHAFTELGERFVVGTRSPGIYVAPLAWRYLARNPNVPTPQLEHDASPDLRVYPISKPHPWRTKRASDPEFSKFYTRRHGIEESTPNGFFTSACSPLIYLDTALPGLHGQLLSCEPAQNLVYRGVVYREDQLLKLRRPEGEKKSEFLASSDGWFNPIALSHAPDGSVAIVDFYREIIEDYSAVPRYLQQQYGLANGRDYGRVLRLTHREQDADSFAKASTFDMSRLTAKELVAELESPRFWRRQTARRLLVEGNLIEAADALTLMASQAEETSAVLGALYTLEAVGKLTPEVLSVALQHENAGVRVHALRLAEPWLDRDKELLQRVLALGDDTNPMVILQLALTLGESRDPCAIESLATIARKHGEVRWLPTAILSSVSGREVDLLAELLKEPCDASFLESLSALIGTRREPEAIARLLTLVSESKEELILAGCLRGLRGSFSTPAKVQLSDEARGILNRLGQHHREEIQSLAQALIVAMKVEDAATRKARLARASRELGDIQLSVERRLAAIDELAQEDDELATAAMLDAFAASTPTVRTAILDAVFARRSRLPVVLAAIEAKQVPASALTAVQRTSLTSHSDPETRKRAEELFRSLGAVDEETWKRFVSALQDKRDPTHGEQVFRKNCANCHQAHGLGIAVGPDLSAEFRRAEETLVRDILSPSSEIAQGYGTYVAQTVDGRVVSGLLAIESPGSIVLREAERKEHIVLRKDIEVFNAIEVSLMPDELAKQLQPRDVADVIAWLRSPPPRRSLFDEDPAWAAALNEGAGTATVVKDNPHRGDAALLVTPPQKFSAAIEGWQFRIREDPAPGEYRYLRFAWKTDGAKGVMIELANAGAWPQPDEPRFRYYAGENTTDWAAVEVSARPPTEWTVVTRDLWKDFGDSTITGIAPTAMKGAALFDSIELLQTSTP
jgi:putative membrane-bound dehydrogenase-like protein